MMRTTFRALFCWFLLCTAALAVTGPDRLSNPAQEARAVALQKQLRCVVCQSQSLDQSDAPLAADLRRLIRARIAAGDSDDAIRRFLVARYGNFILMKPPLITGTYLLWFGPVAVLLIGAMTVFIVVRRARILPQPSETVGNDIPPS